MSNRNELYRSVRLALLASSTSLFGILAAPGMAQEQKGLSVKELDRVEVVGSRIKRSVDIEATQPIEVLTREQIQKTGLNSIFDVLNGLTVSDGGGLSTVTTQTNGSNGAEQISLRGLTASRTLVLVDGKRWATDLDNTVDLTSIPLAIIERIEVLKDGASAIYGSDAVAGVINIVTRRDFDGAQFGWLGGQTSMGDGARTNIDATFGSSTDRSSVVLSLSRSTQDAIMAGSRTISRVPLYGCEELSRMPGYDLTDAQALALVSGPNYGQAELQQYYTQSFAGLCGSGSGEYGNFTVPGLGRVALTPGRPGTLPADFNPFTANDRYNFAPVNYLQQPSERRNGFASARFDLTENATAYAKVSYTQRVSDQQLAQVPITLSVAGTNGPQWRIPISATQVFNPFGVQINTANHRSVAVGPRNPHYDFSTLASMMGVEGKFDVGDKYWSYDIYGQFNETNSSSRGYNYINLFNLRNALGPSRRNATSGALECLDAGGAVIPGCVPYNVFGGPDLGLAAGVITQQEYDAMINYVSYSQVSKQGIESNVFGGVVSGELFDLPGGTAGIALGVERRKDSIFNQPDTLVAGGGSSDNFTEPTRGQTEVTEVFAELVLPLFKDIPGLRELEISAAARKSEYEASGFVGSTAVSNDPGSPTTKKYSLRWKPLEDLLIRASWGETFRAPSVQDLYQGGTETFPSTIDPCSTTRWAGLAADAQARCVAAGVPTGGAIQLSSQLRGLVGGNPQLIPETGENYSFGLVYSPGWASGLNIAADYWHLELKDALSQATAAQVLSECYLDGDAQFCGFVDRAPDGSVSLVRLADFNLNSLETAGIDVAITYDIETERFGRFGVQWNTTWTDYLKQNDDDLTGQYTGSPNWEYRSTANINWSFDRWAIQWTMRHMSSLEEDPNLSGAPLWAYVNDPTVNLDTEVPVAFEQSWHVPSVIYHDLQIAYNAPWNAKIAIGGRNVFGKEPPIVFNTFAHSFDAGYDLPGGAYLYMSYRQDF